MNFKPVWSKVEIYLIVLAIASFASTALARPVNAPGTLTINQTLPCDSTSSPDDYWGDSCGPVATGTGKTLIVETGATCASNTTCQYTFPDQTIHLQAIADKDSFFINWGASYDNSPVPHYFPYTTVPNLTVELSGAESANVTPFFGKKKNVDLVLNALTLSSRNIKINESITGAVVVRNMGWDPSDLANFTFDLTTQRYVGDVLQNYGRSFSVSVPALAPRGKWQWSGSSVLTREGKYVVTARVDAQGEDRTANNQITRVIYVTETPNAVVQGKLLQWGKGKKNINNAVLVLSGAENRRFTLDKNAQNYSFSHLKLGRYQLALQSKNYKSAIHTFEITSGQQVKVIDIGLKDSGVNHAPRVAATATPELAVSNEVVTLKATGTDADGDPLRYEWIIDPFTTKEGAQITHRFAGADSTQTYTVKVKAIDPLGATATKSVTVNVKPIDRGGVRIIKSTDALNRVITTESNVSDPNLRHLTEEDLAEPEAETFGAENIQY